MHKIWLQNHLEFDCTTNQRCCCLTCFSIHACIQCVLAWNLLISFHKLKIKWVQRLWTSSCGVEMLYVCLFVVRILPVTLPLFILLLDKWLLCNAGCWLLRGGRGSLLWKECSHHHTKGKIIMFSYCSFLGQDEISSQPWCQQVVIVQPGGFLC